MPKSYPGFDTCSLATPRLKQLFAGLKIVCFLPLSAFLVFICPEGQLASEAKYWWTIWWFDICSSASSHLKQLFVGLKTEYQPFGIFGILGLFFFFLLYQPQGPRGLKGQKQLDYSVLWHIQTQLNFALPKTVVCGAYNWKSAIFSFHRPQRPNPNSLILKDFLKQHFVIYVPTPNTSYGCFGGLKLNIGLFWPFSAFICCRGQRALKVKYK